MGLDYIVLDELTKRYGSTTAVDQITLTVRQGEFVSLLGPSGCGKTTTLRMVAGLVPPSGGRIVLAGKDVTTLPPYRRGIGLVFQNYALFPHLDVMGNVLFGLQMRNVARAEARKRAESALDLVRLAGYGDRRIQQLSGGEQQRVALARALVIEPTVLLLDEPLSNLDAKLRETMRQEISRIQREVGIATLFVTHDQVEALSMSDRVAVLNHGRVEQFGTPEEIYDRPATRFVADFIGRASFLTMHVEGPHPQGSRVGVPGHGSGVVAQALPVQQQVTLMLRAHRVTLTSPIGDGALRGRVRRVVYLGDVVQYQLAVGNEALLVEQLRLASAADRFHLGDEVAVRWDPAEVLVFDANSKRL